MWVIKKHYDWPLVECEKIDGLRLQDVLSHKEIRVAQVIEDAQRPQLLCREVHQVNHRPFSGYNRAQAAVLELAILVSRLDLLTEEKLNSEIDYLQIAIDKTAGRSEREAWNWLMQSVHNFRNRNCA